jgi:hypothetical protein
MNPKYGICRCQKIRSFRLRRDLPAETEKILADLWPDLFASSLNRRPAEMSLLRGMEAAQAAVNYLERRNGR